MAVQAAALRHEEPGVARRSAFAVPADELTAQAGQAVADLTLEFLENWRTVERQRGRPETEDLEIYRRLAQRKTS